MKVRRRVGRVVRASANLFLLSLAVAARGQQVVDTGEAAAWLRLQAGASSDALGQTLETGDLNGDGKSDLIVGAPGRASQQGMGAGAVYIYFGPLQQGTANLAQEPADVVIAGADTMARLGTAIVTGDINGDMIDDLVIGAPGATGLQRSEAGVAYVVFGHDLWPAELDLAHAADVEIVGAAAFERLGTAVAVGNIDGSGPADLLISSPGATGAAGTASGRTYMVAGAPDLNGLLDLQTTPAAVTVEGAQSQGFFGWALASADLTGDGFDEMVIGAYKVNVGQLIDAGEVYVIFGRSGLPDSVDLASAGADVAIVGPDKRSQFGFSLTTADLNGDKKADLIVGARLASFAAAPLESGVVFGFFGRSAWPDVIDLQQPQADFVAIGASETGQFGYRVAAGDVNDDGASDLFVGVPSADYQDRTDAGEAALLSGAGSGEWNLATRAATITYLGPQADAALGSAVAIADLNGDGIGDAVVSAPAADGGQVWVFAGERAVSVDARAFSQGGSGFFLFPAYPNPFNGSTLIRFRSRQLNGPPALAVFDRLGRRVRTLVPRALGGDDYGAKWDGTDGAGRPVPSGIYVARLLAGSHTSVRKLVLVR